MRTWIRNGHVIDSGRINAPKTITISGKTIESILEPDTNIIPGPQDIIIDATGLVVTPGWIDVHVHLREPGFEHKETIHTGVMAAARGGFTSVCCMPNTLPVNDNIDTTEFIISQAKSAGLTKVYPVGAVTSGSKGQSLSDIKGMTDAGCVAITDDGIPVFSSLMMRKALELAKDLSIPVFSHAEDLKLADGGCMNEGPVSNGLKLKGIPNISESVMILRDIEIAALTGGRLHICHVSCAESVEAIRWGKSKGVRVSGETAPHYFTLTHWDVKQGRKEGANPNFKMNPPLRSENDRLAIIEGLKDGTLDMIATDHAPHSIEEKNKPFEKAPFGIVGLETALPVSMSLVHDGHLSLESLVDKFTKQPAALIGVDNDMKPGTMADITIFDPEAEFTVDSGEFSSKSRNTPFDGMTVRGRVESTLVDGRIVYSRQTGFAGQHDDA